MYTAYINNITKNKEKLNKKYSSNLYFFRKNKEQLIEEFNKKTQVLSVYYEELPPLLFLLSHFSKLFLVAEGESPAIFREEVDYLQNYMQKMNVYLFYNSYFDYPKQKLLKTVRFLIVDLDYITPFWLEHLINYTLKRIKFPPHFILNSGSGVHLIYKIKDVEAYNKYKPFLRDVNTALQYRFRTEDLRRYKVDFHPITHAFRIPGSLTKLAQRTRLFLANGRITKNLEGEYQIKINEYDIRDLAKWLGFKKKEIPNFESKNTTEKKKKQEYKNNIKALPNGKKFGETDAFDWLVSKHEEVNIGNRYYYLFCVAIMGWKYRRKKEEVEETLYWLMDFFNKRDNVKIKEQEITKALKGYNEKFTWVRWKTMSRWTGIQSDVKRNHRSRKTHLKIMNSIRQAQSEELAEKVKELVNKGYKKTDIARILNISRQHVYRLLRKKV